MKKQTERKRAGIDLPSENLHGYTFLLLGERTDICLIDGKKVGFDKDTHTVYLPREKSKERLVKWLKENAERILAAVTKAQAERMGTSYRSISVGSARGRWGSCSAGNDIRYTFRLLYCPKEIIEYVAVHELAHTRHKNHSPRFWQEVERYIPDWKARRKWLKNHGVLMEIF